MLQQIIVYYRTFRGSTVELHCVQSLGLTDSWYGTVKRPIESRNKIPQRCTAIIIQYYCQEGIGTILMQNTLNSQRPGGGAQKRVNSAQEFTKQVSQPALSTPLVRNCLSRCWSDTSKIPFLFQHLAGTDYKFTNVMLLERDTPAMSYYWTRDNIELEFE